MLVCVTRWLRISAPGGGAHLLPPLTWGGVLLALGDGGASDCLYCRPLGLSRPGCLVWGLGHKDTFFLKKDSQEVKEKNPSFTVALLLTPLFPAGWSKMPFTK